MASEYAKISGVVIESIERLNNDKNGNPQYRLHTSEGVFYTAPSASLNYGITNHSSSRSVHPWIIGNPSRPQVDLIVTPRGKQVCYIEIDGESVVR